MRIQPISNNQNFTGKFFFLKPDKAGNILSEDIAKYIPSLGNDDLALIQKNISKRPYDLYISKSDELDGFFEINASAKLEDFLSKKRRGLSEPELLNENKIDRIHLASYEAMQKYENSDGYLNDIKIENPLKFLFRKIFKKG